MRKVQTRLGSVACAIVGAGTPVFLLHANPGDHRDYAGVLPELARSFQTISVDWPGYGESDPPSSPQSVSAMLFADVFEDIVMELKPESPFFIIGNSIGGYSAARFAIRQPSRVKGLVLVGPGGFTPHDWKTRLFCRFKGQEWVTRHIAHAFAKFYLKNRNQYVDDILKRTQDGQSNKARVAVDAAVWRSFNQPDHDLSEQAKKIQAPTLLVWGRKDPVLSVRIDGERAAKAIPRSRLVILETGHEPFAEDPQAFLDAVLPFMTSIDLK